MSSRLHPDDEQLLRYADGELPARRARHVGAHLQACWQCRAALEALQKTVAECVRYRQSVLQAHLPPPPAPWGDLHQRLESIDASLDRVSLLGRMAQVLQFPVRHAKAWVPAAVALAAIWAIVYQFRHTPSVQASELLRKAVAAADSLPRLPRHIRIRTAKHQLTRLAGADVLPAPPELQALFLAAHYNWNDPLNARSFQAWRDQLPDKRDEVTTITDAQAPERGCYQIRTIAASGELLEATLKLRLQDLHPFEEKLQFRNREWVEITELREDRTAPPASIAAGDSGARTAPQIAAHSQTIRKSAPAATVGDELQVLAALHQVGADLGDPIEVTRAGGQILVAGVGIDPQRRQQIQEALRSKPYVVVRFSDPETAPVEPETPAPAGTAASPEVSQLQARIEKQLGGRASFEQLSSQLLDSSDAMMSRAYALRRLAERFPRGIEAQMAAEDRQILRDLHHEHAAALRREATAIERLLDPVLVALGGSAGGVGGSAPDSWQSATEDAFQAARRVETLLAGMLGVAPGQTAGRDLPSQLLFSLAQLRVNLDTCERLMTIPPGRKAGEQKK